MNQLYSNHLLIVRWVTILFLLGISCMAVSFSPASADTCKKKPSTLSLDLTAGTGAGFNLSGKNGTENILLAANSMNALYKALRMKGSLNAAQLIEFRRVSGILNQLHSTLIQGAYNKDLNKYYSIKNKQAPASSLNVKTYQKIDRLMIGRLK